LELGECVGRGLCDEVVERRVLGNVHGLRAVLAEITSDAGRAGSEHHGIRVAEVAHLREDLQRGGFECPVLLLCVNEDLCHRQITFASLR
jgi:hypothetical protein